MGAKEIRYFSQKVTAHETVRITDCGYHETQQGHYSSQKVIDHYVLHCIERGYGVYTVGGLSFSLGPGDCFLLMPHVPILYQSDVRDPWVYYWIGFEGVNLSPLLSQCGLTKEKPVIHVPKIGELIELIRPLVQSGTPSVPDAYEAIGKFYLICSKMIAENSKTKEMTNQETYVNRVLGLIQDSYYKDISVQKLADAVGLDRSYLHRIFREYCGKSIQEYITELRMNRAVYLVMNTDMNMKDIAYFCGYASEQYFSLAFREKNGISPLKYRKIHALEKKSDRKAELKSGKKQNIC